MDMPTILHNPTFVGGAVSRMLGASVEPQYRGVWVVNLKRGAKTRLVTDGNVAVPSPDGSQFVFHANRGSGVFDLFIRPVSGSGGDTLLVPSTENKIAMDWSRDGRSWSTSAQTPRPSRTCGCCRRPAIVGLRRSWQRRSTRLRRGCPPTAAGSLTRRTSQAAGKCMCSRSRCLGASRRCPWAEAPSRSGGRMARSCSTWLPTAA